MKRLFIYIFLFLLPLSMAGRSTDDDKTILLLRQKCNKSIRNQNFSQAFLHLEKLLELAPESPDVLFAYAKVCMRLDRYERAMQVLSSRCKYIAGVENQVKLQAWLGSLYACQGKFHLALKASTQSLLSGFQTNIQNPELIASLFNNIACLNIYTSAIEGMPGEAAHISFGLKRLQRSIAYLRIAYHYNPYDPIIQDNLAYLQETDTTGTVFTDLNDKLIKAHREYRNRITEEKTAQEQTIPEKRSEDTPHLLQNLDGLVKTLKRYDQLVFILDYSFSMTETYKTSKDIHDGEISRDELMKMTMDYTLKELDKSNKVGVITVNGECDMDPKMRHPVTDEIDKDDLNRFIQSMNPSGATPLNQIFSESIDLFDLEAENKKAIVLLSDGVNTCGDEFEICEISQQFNAQEVDIFVLSYLLENRNYLTEYAIYNCIANKELMGINKDLAFEDKNVEINPNIFSFPFIPEIRHYTCRHAFNMFCMDADAIEIPEPVQDDSLLYNYF